MIFYIIISNSANTLEEGEGSLSGWYSISNQVHRMAVEERWCVVVCWCAHQNSAAFINIFMVTTRS